MEVTYKSLACKSATITDPKTNELLYTLDTHLRKPQITVIRSNETDPFATASIPAFSRSVDISIEGRDLKLTTKKLFKMHYSFETPNLTQPELTWSISSGLKTVDFVCLDQQQLPVARFTTHVASLKRIGTFEIEESYQQNTPLVDELVVTGLTVAYLWLITFMASPAAGVAAM